jgi:tight adherence protein C
MSAALMPLFLVLAGSAAMLVYLGLRKPAQAANIEERLAQFAERPMTLEELELSLPFRDRVLMPTLLTVSRKLARFTPRSNLEKLRRDLIEAGSPSKLGVTEFMGLRVVFALACGGWIFLMFALSGTSLRNLIIFPAALGAIGYMIPGMWLNKKIKARRKAIQLALADAIDLLTISVEAGLGFDPAMQRVVEKWNNPLTQEFGRMLSEMRIGKSRREAMRELSERNQVDDLRVFISSIIQADQLGVSITQVLRTQSKAMRIRRRQRAEELAHKAPIKMIFPMVLLIFPAMYVVILGPALPQILNSI